MALKTFTTADGSANQALVTNGSGVLSFAAVGASAGQVIQVITATDSTQRNTAGTTYVTASNTLSVTITPSSASNKIYVVSTLVGAGVGEESNGLFSIFRGATNLGDSTYGLAGVQSNIGRGSVAMSVLDSPATTSATTYQVYMRKQDASPSNMNMNTTGTKGVITCLEIKG